MLLTFLMFGRARNHGKISQIIDRPLLAVLSIATTGSAETASREPECVRNETGSNKNLENLICRLPVIDDYAKNGGPGVV